MKKILNLNFPKELSQKQIRIKQKKKLEKYKIHIDINNKKWVNASNKLILNE